MKGYRNLLTMLIILFIFAVATSQAIVPTFQLGRKVRTAQSNAPVKSRLSDENRERDSATENNLNPFPLSLPIAIGMERGSKEWKGENVR